MAKSLRSKTKRAARSIKRKLIFAPVEDDRLQRLAKKQAIQSTDMDTPETNMMEVVLSKNEIKRLAMSKHQIYKKNKSKRRNM